MFTEFKACLSKSLIALRVIYLFEVSDRNGAVISQTVGRHDHLLYF